MELHLENIKLISLILFKAIIVISNSSVFLISIYSFGKWSINLNILLLYKIMNFF